MTANRMVIFFGVMIGTIFVCNLFRERVEPLESPYLPITSQIDQQRQRAEALEREYQRIAAEIRQQRRNRIRNSNPSDIRPSPGQVPPSYSPHHA